MHCKDNENSTELKPFREKLMKNLRNSRKYTIFAHESKKILG